ncbi:BnaC04g48470D [Brassica napus]|uniref:BnaC04g48470D protein n=1 Tax=Brassica napus TaxID=3708 RepID=A0A078FK77_BRANA|nr:BnaC04g48470D [Brassica napus]
MARNENLSQTGTEDANLQFQLQGRQKF